MSEISGIIRNGIERGWPMEEIKVSLLNSGYSPQEVIYELNLINNTQSPLQPVAQVVEIPSPQNKFNPQDLTNYQAPLAEKQASNFVVIAIIILLVLCVLVGAGFFLFG